MAKKLTCTFYMGGEPIERVTDEWREVMMKRVSEAMSLYYTAHPDEYAKIKDKEA